MTKVQPRENACISRRCANTEACSKTESGWSPFHKLMYKRKPEREKYTQKFTFKRMKNVLFWRESKKQ